MLADKIIAQHSVGLISWHEARSELRRLSKQARFNADYSDDSHSYDRWQNEARRAADNLRVMSSRPHARRAN